MSADELIQRRRSPFGEVDWRAPSQAAHPARDAGLASYDAVCRQGQGRLARAVAEDGWIEDPVGVSRSIRPVSATTAPTDALASGT